MTHFTVGIIVPEDKLPDIHSFISDQMKPYDESTRVAPYVSYSIDKAKAEIERDIIRLERIVERRDPGYNLNKCQEILAKLRVTTPEERYREYAEFHDHFNAKGEPLSTYNPDSKWTGGSSEAAGTAGSPARKTPAARPSSNIAIRNSSIERGIILHAIVTLDGQWHERGQMGLGRS